MPLIDEVSIILPCYNEDIGIIQKSIDAVHQISDSLGIRIELILVDDSGFARLSKCQYITGRCILITNSVNMGKGASIRRAVEVATSRYLIYTDCDLPIDLKQFMSFIGNEDFERQGILFCGNRWHSSSVTIRRNEINIPRIVMSRSFRTFIWLLSRGKLRDSQCPAKFMRTDLAKILFPTLTQDRYAFDVQLLFCAYNNGITIAEVPVIFDDLRASMSWRSAVLHTASMIKDVIRHHGRTGKISSRAG